MIPLYDYQQDAVRDMIAGKVLNTSRVGTGKTLMALGCLENLNATTSMVVAPKSLLLQWSAETSRFMPDVYTQVVQGAPLKRIVQYEEFRKATGAKLLIVSYETLRIDINHIASIMFDCIVYDEVHKLKEPNTQIKKKLKFLIAKRRFGLSGSPVVNHYGNTYNILSSLNPQAFPNYYAFVNTFTIKSQVKGLLIFRDQEKIRQMFAPYIVSKNLEDAGKSLPPLQEIELEIGFSDKERRIYDKMLMELIFDFESGDVDKLSSPMMLQNTLAKIGKLQEVADHLSLVGSNNDSSKLEALIELMEDQILPEEKVIIFTRFSRMAEIIARSLRNSYLITGQTKNRQIHLDQFKEDGKYLVMTNAGREGLNIQEANVVVMYDQDYTASGMEQRVGRAYRLGQEKRVRVYHLLVRGTIDYRIRKLLGRKKALADDLQDTIKELLKQEL